MKVMKLKVLLYSLLVFTLFVVSAWQSPLIAQKKTANRASNYGFYNVRNFGAKGDAKTVDSPAVNRAIEAAAQAGGGTVYFPAGTYLSFSIRLKSNITLYLDNGATLLAADPQIHKGNYDEFEPNAFDMYQDFGHSHWKNSLIWGIDVENVAILGQGKIDGQGLTRRSPGPQRPRVAGDTPVSMSKNVSPLGETSPIAEMQGLGNKAIALKNARNVTLRDFTIFRAGHFGLLATGVDNLTIDNLRVDTNRDGFDIDACRNVRISNSYVNSPNDDAIVLKSSYALGYPRATENVTITNVQVSGFDLGTFLNGTFQTTQEFAPDKDRPTGRIKLGTESNGGFKNITISNSVFVHSRGLAIETVDGGNIEDVSVSNLTMRDITTAPIFIRLGRRQRAPEGTPISRIKRINISNVVVSDADAHYASLIVGLPGYDIEDVKLSNIFIEYKGGGTREDAALEVPEKETNYPEPSMFGRIPAYGFYVRHARNIEFSNVEVSYKNSEARPAYVLDDVKTADFYGIRAKLGIGAKMFSLRNTTDFRLRGSRNMSDTTIDRAEKREF